MKGIPPNVMRLGRALFVAATAAAVAIACQRSWSDIADRGLPSPGAVALAVTLLIAALVTASLAYSSLYEAGGRMSAARAFILAVPAKYLPLGGLAQLGTQISMSAKGGVGHRKATMLSGIQIYVTVVVRIGIGGAIYLFATGIDGRFRLLAMVAPLALLALYRPFMVAVLARLSKLSRRFPDESNIPEADALQGSMSWTVLNVLVNELAFAVLLLQFSPDLPLAQVVGGFAWAWVVGFLVLPLPSGLGAREAALVLLVPSAAGAEILAASLVHRALIIAVEIVGALAVAKPLRRTTEAPAHPLGASRAVES